MQIIDATPPADFPAQVIVAQDTAFTERHPNAAHYLRVNDRTTRSTSTSCRTQSAAVTHARRPALWGSNRRTGLCQVTAVRTCSDRGNYA